MKAVQSGGTTVTYFYDAADHLTQIQQAAGTGGANPTAAQTVGFLYDTANRPTTVTLPNGITETYGYDNASQLLAIVYKKADGTTIGDLAHTYSPGGNLARTGFPAALPDQQYDGNNRLTVSNGIAQAYHNNGALTNDGSHTYAWNNRDQLGAITGANSATFTYDAFGRRRSANVNGQVTVYLYDSWNPIQLKTNTGVVVESRLYGPGLDQIYARTRNGVTESFLTDALGSVVELRDGAQAKTVEYTYDPYGGIGATISALA